MKCSSRSTVVSSMSTAVPSLCVAIAQIFRPVIELVEVVPHLVRDLAENAVVGKSEPRIVDVGNVVGRDRARLGHVRLRMLNILRLHAADPGALAHAVRSTVTLDSKVYGRRCRASPRSRQGYSEAPDGPSRRCSNSSLRFWTLRSS